MALIDELKERRTAVSAEMDRLEAVGRDIDREWKAQECLFGDLDTAIRALDPLDPPTEEEMFGDQDEPAPIVNADEGWELEPSPAELFAAEKSEARELLEREDGASEFAEPMPDPEFVVLDEQTCEPVEEAPALNEQMQDERELTAALPQPEWNEPRQSISMIDEQTCEPVDPTLRAFEDDHIVEPQPTEGYAPVTNPEADALARAHDWYSPEKVAERNKFNPWGGVAHLFGKPKVDA